jgi:hypothetical protein
MFCSGFPPSLHRRAFPNETHLNPEFLFTVFPENNQDVKKYFHRNAIFRWHFFYPIQEINL